MKKLSNTEAELKKCVAYKTSVYAARDTNIELLSNHGLQKSHPCHIESYFK